MVLVYLDDYVLLFLGDDSYVHSLALQPDGKIVLAGAAGSYSDKFGLALYDPDGGLDSTSETATSSGPTARAAWTKPSMLPSKRTAKSWP